MEHITTFTGEDFTPITPSANQIHIVDIAHALSLMCRANGHIVRFYPVAQHSINCANEAKERGYSDKVQLACLLHDASEAYLSDITKPIKKHFPKYMDVEKHLQETIFSKYLSSPLSDCETEQVEKVDEDLLKHEFKVLMKKKVFDCLPVLKSNPSFELASFLDIENEYIRLYTQISKQPLTESLGLTEKIAFIESEFQDKNKSYVLDFVGSHNISALFTEKHFIKSLSAQVDVAIHAYGILLALSKILGDDERIEYLSLGAGNTGKPFDVSTLKRVAEFKFAQWADSRNAIRQNSIFKDFLELALYNDSGGRKKYIYCYSAAAIIKFLSSSNRNLESVLSRNSIRKREKYSGYQLKYRVVKDFYVDFKNEVEIVELAGLI